MAQREAIHRMLDWLHGNVVSVLQPTAPRIAVVDARFVAVGVAAVAAISLVSTLGHLVAIPAFVALLVQRAQGNQPVIPQSAYKSDRERTLLVCLALMATIALASNVVIRSGWFANAAADVCALREWVGPWSAVRLDEWLPSLPSFWRSSPDLIPKNRCRVGLAITWLIPVMATTIFALWVHVRGAPRLTRLSGADAVEAFMVLAVLALLASLVAGSLGKPIKGSSWIALDKTAHLLLWAFLPSLALIGLGYWLAALRGREMNLLLPPPLPRKPNIEETNDAAGDRILLGGIAIVSGVLAFFTLDAYFEQGRVSTGIVALVLLIATCVSSKWYLAQR